MTDQRIAAACGQSACTGHTVDRSDEARATALVLDALGRSVATVEAPAEAIRRAVAWPELGEPQGLMTDG